jgi:TonB dependent receptor/Carboxypeptidase regulatory-like domain
MLCALSFVRVGRTQDTVTGAFEGTVTNNDTGALIAGATAEIINQQTGLSITKTTDSKGRFYQGLLNPGLYTIRVSAPGYQTQEVQQRLFITRTGEVVPVPVALEPLPATTPTATATATPTPTQPAAGHTEEDTDIRARIDAADGERGGAFTEEEVSTLPLGATSFVRSFDELALLLPGVAPPPQTLGSVAGPGIGAGVGSAGQFSVNGLRSRANNFTVDGSDNNDEDIGVRRQGFVSLIPQPIESIKEYQAITLLAPAQFGRNIGAQANAVSKSGGAQLHGTLYGFFNSSQLNARNAFDTAFGNASTPLRTTNNQPVLLDGAPFMVQNQSKGQDSFTFTQSGFVLGGPITKEKRFFFVSAEAQRTNASEEHSFAVPTVEQRGVFGTGATGIFQLPPSIGSSGPVAAFPTTEDGDAIFSLFPFPNNPQGIYGANTFTQSLPAGGKGQVFSGKFDDYFKFHERQQSFTARYNFTQDARIIPVTGEALFSSLKPRVRTQNLSLFLNSEFSGPNSTRPLFNQVRLSYGRTRLNFEEVRDTQFLRPSSLFPNVPFLLNAPYRVNDTLPAAPGVPNSGPVNYISTGFNVEDVLGAIGQVKIAGFSPVGVDVFNFPQRRVNNTYQFADNLTWRTGNHNFAFGADIRRTELNSDAAPNARPLVTFDGAPEVTLGRNGAVTLTGRFFRAVDLAAASAPSGFMQTLATINSDVQLRFYQLDFYGQDTWRVTPRLSLSFGLRYEYNTVPRESQHRIEDALVDPALNDSPDLMSFTAGRTRIFDPDKKDFAPRLGIAYSPNWFGPEHPTVVRGGYGLFYDPPLGAVVTQSRNVFPNFFTVNFAGGTGSQNQTCESPFPCGELNLLNPSDLPFIQRNSLNRIRPGLDTLSLIQMLNDFVTGSETNSFSIFGATLPARQLKTPRAHQFTVGFEQLLSRHLSLSAAYVGTRGRNLLRFTTPNLGPNTLLIPAFFDVLSSDEIDDQEEVAGEPRFFGFAIPPLNRPKSGFGAVSRFETTGRSRYDALQLQVRGRYTRRLQFQLAYTLSKTMDDVSDVFDLAGAFALPQDSLNPQGEYAPANFDARHRFAYNYLYELPTLSAHNKFTRALFGGLQFAGLGSFQTGTPFTVNSTLDINLDGNLTDRLNTLNGLVITGNRRQPLQLTVAQPATLLAPFGQDGQIGRNTFRAGSVLSLNMAIIKNIAVKERQRLTLRMEIFNFINRANYGVPIRFLEFPGFGQADNTVTPARRIQFALKYSF